MTNADLYLAELTVYDPSLPGERVLRYSTGRGFVTTPNDTPADLFFDAKIKQPALVRRDLFTEGATFGRSRMGYGDLVLFNEDGSLDALLNYGFDGRQIVIRKGTESAAYPGGFAIVLVGTMEQPEVTSSTVTIKVRDRQFELEVALQPTKYAGDNALPTGLEGVAEDLKGKPKPVCYGVVKNISAPCVNTSKLIFQVNDGPISAVDAVYDQGYALTPAGTYASEADLLNDMLAPALSEYKVYPAGGYFRLGGSPSGLVTADVTEGATSAERTAGQLFVRILTRAGKTSGDWSASDVDALDTAIDAELGVWVSEEVNCSDVLDGVASSAGAWWGVDRDGVFRIQQLDEPSGEPVLALTENDLLQPLDRRATTDQHRGLPVYRCIVRYGRNYTVQTTDVAGSVTDARRAVIAAEWREASATDTGVQTAHLLSPVTIEDSLLVHEADAVAEATRRQVLRGARRDCFELSVPLNTQTNVVDLGNVIQLAHHRYGLSTGKLFRVLGLEPNAEARTILLTVWG